MYVPVTDNDEPFFSEGLAVRFYRESGEDWVANFKPGWAGFTTVIEFTASAYILVIAFGRCYIMDPDQLQPLAVFGIGYTKTFSTQDGRTVLQEQNDFTVVEPDGRFWHTVRISWDGLEEVRLDKNIITGLAYNVAYDDGEWSRFYYNIDTKELINGSYP